MTEETPGIDRREVIAIINTSPDAIDLLQDMFERAGYVVVTTFTHDIRDGKVDLESFMRTHRPKVVVYDVAPPPERNYRFLLHLRLTTLKDYNFVVTINSRREAMRARATR